MHPSAMENAKSFFDCYSGHFPSNDTVKVVEIGSQDVNGSLKDVCPTRFRYVGVDFISAKNVDVVLSDPYQLPFDTESVDIVLTSSCLEHSEMFWLVYLEMLRVLKPHGLLYMNVPSRGKYHRYPVDCWRFYPDSSFALNTWAKRSGYNPVVLEAYTQPDGEWGDSVGIVLKDENFLSRFPDRVLHSKSDFVNGRQQSSSEEILNVARWNVKDTIAEKLKHLISRAPIKKLD